MAKDKKLPVKDRMIAAFLALVSERGWELVELEDIAGEAGVPLSEAQEYFDDKTDILSAYGRKLDQKILENVDKDDTLSCRDKLFDLLMERFDHLNEDREAIIAVLCGIKSDPKEAVLSFPHLGKSMSRMMEAAGIDTSGIVGAVKVAGLSGIYLYTLRCWKNDDSEDMAKTMATLDKALDKAETLYNSFPVK